MSTSSTTPATMLSPLSADELRLHSDILRLQKLEKSAPDGFACDELKEHLMRDFEGFVRACIDSVWMQATATGVVAALELRRENDLDELLSEGRIGLLKALRGFDASRATPFRAYAGPMVRGEARRFLRDKAAHIREAAWRQGTGERTAPPRTRLSGLVDGEAGDRAATTTTGSVDLAAVDPAPDFRLLTELRADVERALDAPPPDDYSPRRRAAWENQARALRMFFFEQKSKTEISRELGCSVFNVCHLIEEGKARVASALADAYADTDDIKSAPNCGT